MVMSREVVEQFHVGNEAAASVVALDQVMAEDLVLREDIPNSGLEGIDLVDSLTGERTGSEQVLIDVGNGGCVRIDARGSSEDAGEKGARGGDQAQADARLQD